jgi:hypothetical protein
MPRKQSSTQTCFVVGPIGDDGSPTRGHADWLLDEIITPVFDEHFKDFDVIRSDKITQPGMIDSQVINRLLDADLVIADLSLLNANAFYEIGLRHMERKPIIHMFRAGEIIPFDVKPYRAIPFAFEHPKQRFEARDQLKQAVEAVLTPGYQVENPVTRARGYAELSQHAMPGMDVILTEIESLKSRVQRAERAAAVAQDAAMRAMGSPPIGVGLAPSWALPSNGFQTEVASARSPGNLAEAIGAATDSNALSSLFRPKDTNALSSLAESVRPKDANALSSLAESVRPKDTNALSSLVAPPKSRK